MIRLLIGCACVLAATIGTAEAQSASSVTVGAVVELPARTATTSSGSNEVRIKGMSLGVGFPLGKASLEFAGFWHSAEIDIDRDADTVVTETRVVNRDVPFVAAVRYKPDCPNRWCAEVMGGVGINFSRRSTIRVGDCGSSSQPISPCIPATGPAFEFNKEEPTVFIGTAVTVRVFGRLELGPSFRLWYVGRYRDKTPGHAAQLNLRRTPNNERLELGVTAIWHLKRQ